MTTEITREQLEEKIKNTGDFILIDVRKPSEFAAGSIDGAILVPLGEFVSLREISRGEKNKIKNFNFSPEKEIIVYCQSGRRSGAAAEILEKLGYENVKNLKGGIFDWKNKF